ncbi:MAG: hypothetical protein WBW84_04335 [Acidobacteriaceae bacterium]
MRGPVGEVLFDIALRIDDDGGAGRLVGEEAGRVRETAEIVLLQEHRVEEASRESAGPVRGLVNLPTQGSPGVASRKGTKRSLSS